MLTAEQQSIMHLSAAGVAFCDPTIGPTPVVAVNAYRDNLMRDLAI
jgi:hypothetical protein